MKLSCQCYGVHLTKIRRAPSVYVTQEYLNYKYCMGGCGILAGFWVFNF